MKLLSAIILKIVLAAAILPHTAEAAPVQYRCDGFVQFRPCGQEIATGKRPRNKSLSADFGTPRFDVSAVALSSGSKPYAEILKQTMSQLGATTGQWQGSIRGNGNIHLQLLWFRDGVLASTRSMGNVKLIHKVTSFAFRTTLPRGPGWSWKIAALATALS